MAAMVLRVGLTGGIACGKSEVSTRLRELGAVVIDADVVAREVVEPGSPGLAQIVSTFGPDVLDGAGRLDRSTLSGLVFADPQARRQLESIVHPRVRARARELESRAPKNAVVVHDIPLLVETGQESTFDAVVVVDCPPAVQLDRLVRLRGMDPAQARSRIAAQAAPERRREAADYLIDNTGSITELRTRVDRVWADLTGG